MPRPPSGLRNLSTWAAMGLGTGLGSAVSLAVPPVSAVLVGFGCFLAGYAVRAYVSRRRRERYRVVRALQAWDGR